jgi:hypothetical protein
LGGGAKRRIGELVEPRVVLRPGVGILVIRQRGPYAGQRRERMTPHRIAEVEEPERRRRLRAEDVVDVQIVLVQRHRHSAAQPRTQPCQVVRGPVQPSQYARIPRAITRAASKDL